MRVVVDLPFVPVTSTVGRLLMRLDMMSGSTLLATSPPIMPPDPRPVALDADVATFAEMMAAALRKRRRGAGSESFMKNESS